MKKAVAYIDVKAILELLKVPHNVGLVGMEYPSKDDKIKITLTGDTLPVKKTSAKAKRFPAVKYSVLRHWHVAKIEPASSKEIDDETEDES